MHLEQAGNAVRLHRGLQGARACSPRQLDGSLSTTVLNSNRSRRKASQVCGVVAGPRAQLQSLQIARAAQPCARCNDGAANMCEPYDYTMHGEGQQPVLPLRAASLPSFTCSLCRGYAFNDKYNSRSDVIRAELRA